MKAFISWAVLIALLPVIGPAYLCGILIAIPFAGFVWGFKFAAEQVGKYAAYLEESIK